MTAPTASVTITAAAADGLTATLGGAWDELEEAMLALVPTPLESQPSAYIRESWAGRNHGSTATVHIAAAVAGDELLVRLRWDAPNPQMAVTDINNYPDACALLFPANGSDAELSTMGSDADGVCGWHWRAGAAEAFVITAGGLGTVEREKDHSLDVSSEWASGEWRVRFSAKLGGSLPPVRQGTVIPLGAAVWAGAGEERAGLKAHTPVWHSLAIEGTERNR